MNLAACKAEVIRLYYERSGSCDPTIFVSRKSGNKVACGASLEVSTRMRDRYIKLWLRNSEKEMKEEQVQQDGMAP